MEETERGNLEQVAHTIRVLSVDAIEKAQSGHPGLPLGAAEIGAYLFMKVLRHNPKNPEWPGRDRFVLSAGHGSMLLYSLLHLCGYDLTMEDIKAFRQLGSKTPGHPEFGEAPGVETTTGPLGQGVACGVGMAIAQKMVAARFGSDLYDSKVWVLAGDGCIMEGVSSEASSLAGTLALDNLVVMFDSNRVCLDGPIEEVNLEDTAKRYEAYGFRVLEIDGYDWAQIETACAQARAERGKPVFLIVNTVIGRYAPTIQGTFKAHGGALGAEEIDAVKKAIGWTEPPFTVPDDVRNYCAGRLPEWEKQETDWNARLEVSLKADPEKARLWQAFRDKTLPDDWEDQLWNLEIPKDLPTRKANEFAINKVCALLPWMVSGSADVSSCDFTWILNSEIATKDLWATQQVKFGVREFGMAASAYGMSLHGFVRPAVGTFLTFSDYMRNGIRLAALMKQPVIFVFSHDSVFLAEDGPTHQPVEHLMSLRLIPNLTLIRPGDESEVKMAWATALRMTDGPVALCFTRQPVASTVSEYTTRGAKEGVARGAYLLYGNPGADAETLIVATGSEIHPAVGVAKKLETDGIKVRVVSMPSWELFEKQEEGYRNKVLGGSFRLRVSLEAGVSLGWQKFVGSDGLCISMETFGASAPPEVLADHFGFTVEKVYAQVKEALGSAGAIGRRT
ncbi:MAG: transketolase [Verrucomicrobia bacterium]|nr:MAG: transketolase [Verrucomicrobiota bacterium]